MSKEARNYKRKLRDIRGELIEVRNYLVDKKDPAFNILIRSVNQAEVHLMWADEDGAKTPLTQAESAN